MGRSDILVNIVTNNLKPTPWFLPFCASLLSLDTDRGLYAGADIAESISDWSSESVAINEPCARRVLWVTYWTRIDYCKHIRAFSCSTDLDLQCSPFHVACCSAHHPRGEPEYRGPHTTCQLSWVYPHRTHTPSGAEGTYTPIQSTHSWWNVNICMCNLHIIKLKFSLACWLHSHTVTKT